MTLENSLATVKQAIALFATPVVWGRQGADVGKLIREQHAASEAIAALPKLTAHSSPVYASVDEGQSGTVVAAHLAGDELASLPWHIATEMLDALAMDAAAVTHTASPERQREQLFSGYGPALAELICQGIDDSLASAGQSYKRLRSYDGKQFAPLTDTELDEPYFETCDASAEHAMPATTFDFYDAIEAARELIEQRDEAARKARRGE